MDIFGILSGLTADFETRCRSARGTGRSTVLVDMATEDDVVVVLHGNYENEFRALFLQRRRAGTQLPRIVRCKADLAAVLRDTAGMKIKGRVLFDHSWLERLIRSDLWHLLHEVSNASQVVGFSNSPVTDSDAETRLLIID